MKFTLKDYQAEATDNLLRSLAHAKAIVDTEGQPVSASLSATTGAGKTVIAAAVIEALFDGSDAFGFDADPGAVVIWFSDDPNLNEQTRFRLMEASEKLGHTRLVTIEAPFSKPRLEPGKVYFLNTQKLSKSSLLTRGHVDEVVAEDGGVAERLGAMPDKQGWTIWQTIANTIDDDSLTVYLIIDEAHRGFNTKTSREKSTLVSKLVNGHAGYPPIPIVWGISATIERFKEAMDEAKVAKSRRPLPPVAVDGFRVQESGLIKDTVVLNIPAEAGNFDTALVRMAARKLRDSSERWDRYAKMQQSAEIVKPLLVLQSANTPDPDQLGRALDVIFAEFPELGANAVRHVLGDHTTQQFGAWDVDWIEPQHVEDRTQVRILIAKDAISTGWDCPRAEVLVSFRPATDHTYITQLLGRMMRSPLAMRIPGDDKLNSVECILPYFDRTTAGNVVRFITGQISDMTSPRKVVVQECLLEPNPAITEQVWQAWDAIPTITVPRRDASPVTRLSALALELSRDGLRANALAETRAAMHAVLDAARAEHPKLLDKAVDEIWAVRVQSIAGRLDSKVLTYTDFIERADDRAIQVGFNDAKRAFGADVAQTYVTRLAADDPDDDGLRDAYVTTSALAILAEARATIDREAEKLADAWFVEYSPAIKGLPDIRQQEYSDIQALATTPQRSSLTRPRNRIEDYVEVFADGTQAFAPVVDRHLMSDENGVMPLGSLNTWERFVVETELKRPETVAWYRNPSQPSVDSLGVPYRDEQGRWRSMHPDFVFFVELGGVIRPTIVDPHGDHLADSLVKLRGLAKFAEDYGTEFERIESVSEVGNHLFVLDLQQAHVRDAILGGDMTVDGIYGSIAVRYPIQR